MNKTNYFIKHLGELGLTVAFAESITCGMATHKLASYKGAADVLAGSVVCYTPEVKISLLKVSRRMIDQCTCESPEVTKALVKGLQLLIAANIHAALTGLASDGGSETKDKPVGTVFYCVRYKGKYYSSRYLFRGTPFEIRAKACEKLYTIILELIK